MNTRLTNIIFNPKSRNDYTVSAVSHLGIGSVLFYLVPKIFNKLGSYHSFLGSGMVKYTAFIGAASLYFRVKWLNEQSSSVTPPPRKEGETDRLAKEIEEMDPQAFQMIDPFKLVGKACEYVRQAKDDLEENLNQNSQSVGVSEKLNEAITYLEGLKRWFIETEKQAQERGRMLYAALGQGTEGNIAEVGETMLQMQAINPLSPLPLEPPEVKVEEID